MITLLFFIVGAIAIFVADRRNLSQFLQGTVLGIAMGAVLFHPLTFLALLIAIAARPNK